MSAHGGERALIRFGAGRGALLTAAAFFAAAALWFTAC